MGHYFESGFSVRKPMWHGLGTVPEDNPGSIDEVMDWTFEGNPWEPVYCGVLTTTESGRCESRMEDCRNPGTHKVQVFEGIEPDLACPKHADVARANGFTVTPMDVVETPGWQAIKRSDNGHLLHVSKTSFEVFGNRESAELLVKILDTEDPDFEDLNVKFVTGIVLKEGGVVVYTAYLDHEYDIPGYEGVVYPFCPIINHHDGTGSLKVLKSSIMPVCWNTTSAAEAQAETSGFAYSFRHSKNIRENIEAAREALFTVRTDTEEWVRYATEMVAIPITDEQVEQFLMEFVPMPPKTTDRVARNVEEARQAIRSFYDSAGVGGTQGTALGVILAAGEYLDHGRTWRSKETYVSRTMLRPEQGKTQAMRLVEDIVGVEQDDIMAKVSA